jgi:hypothetical protein
MVEEGGKANKPNLGRQFGPTADDGDAAFPAAEGRADSSFWRRFSSFLAFLSISRRRFSN